MISLTSPVRTRAHSWPAGGKLLALCVASIALFGALSYGYWGVHSSVEIAWSTGYVYWPALLGIGVASVPFAKIGAQLAARLPDAILRRLFGALLFFVGFGLLAAN